MYLLIDVTLFLFNKNHCRNVAIDPSNMFPSQDEFTRSAFNHSENESTSSQSESRSLFRLTSISMSNDHFRQEYNIIIIE